MDAYSAFAEPTRPHIIELLVREGELPASSIYDKFSVSHAAISQHLKVLREANLVKTEKRAQQRIYSINPEPILEMEAWLHTLEKVWYKRFDRLEKVLEEEKKLKNREQKTKK